VKPIPAEEGEVVVHPRKEAEGAHLQIHKNLLMMYSKAYIGGCKCPVDKHSGTIIPST
jgi:hypothetical protein